MNVWVGDESVELDDEKVADAVARCVRAAEIIETFRATDESVFVLMEGRIAARVYPAGYVEELIEDIRNALRGEEAPAVDAEAHED